LKPPREVYGDIYDTYKSYIELYLGSRSQTNKYMKKITIANAVLATTAATFLASCGGGGSNDNSLQVADPVEVQVTIAINQPVGFAQILVASHDGSEDFFDTGSEASSEVELMAELGDVSGLESTLSPLTSYDVETTAPNPQGTTVTLNLTIDEVNHYFSYISMALPSSDLFIGNNNALDISSLLEESGAPIVINVDRLYDAGTEVNNLENAPGGPLVGLDAGTPTDGIDENGLITLASPDHFSTTYGATSEAFLNGFDLTTIDPNGAEVATITITRLP